MIQEQGFGDLIRDEGGDFLVGFLGSLGNINTSTLQAELKAIEFGLILAWDSGVRKLICHSDSRLGGWAGAQGY